MELKDEWFARFGHVAIAITILLGKGYFESKDSVFLGHGYHAVSKAVWFKA